MPWSHLSYHATLHNLCRDLISHTTPLCTICAVISPLIPRHSAQSVPWSHLSYYATLHNLCRDLTSHTTPFCTIYAANRTHLSYHATLHSFFCILVGYSAKAGMLRRMIKSCHERNAPVMRSKDTTKRSIQNERLLQGHSETGGAGIDQMLVERRLKSQAQYWRGFESQVRQKIFLRESTFNADSYVQPPCAVAWIIIYIRTLKIPNTDRYTKMLRIPVEVCRAALAAALPYPGKATRISRKGQ